MKKNWLKRFVSFFSRTFRKPTERNKMLETFWKSFDDGKWHTLYASQNAETSAKEKKEVK